ncbi:hypothetical protein L3Y34_006783 [Caenorhabditis briggsae]|uniref:Uncharacterized protein n=1 Tax=Caenorhabditis briggsae TaxID=6238 RepID=A0AAE8ZV46_CAEBR|nr:hypothetical protein L3Y34_006783 [Caenorhabditis briggsae]
MHILVDIFIFILGSINVFIDFELLYSIFIARTLTKSETLTLFYFRLLIDGIAGLGEFSTTTVDVLNEMNLLVDPVVTFSTYHPNVLVTTIRSLLVVVITLDRMFAVFVPISYRAQLSSIPNWVLMLFV